MLIQSIIYLAIAYLVTEAVETILEQIENHDEQKGGK